MKRAITILTAVLCLLALAATSEAITITADGTMRFDCDGFENDTVGTDPSVTTKGSWILKQVASGNVEVYSEEGLLPSGGPGAHEGDNYLMLYNKAGNSYRDTAALALMEDNLGGMYSAAPGAAVVSKWSMHLPAYLPEDTPNAYVAHFVKGTTGFSTEVHNRLIFGYNDVTQLYEAKDYDYDTSAYYNITTGGGATIMTVSPTTWAEFQCDLTVGDEWTLTINGVESDVLNIHSGFAADSVVGMHFYVGNSAQAGQFYIDGFGGGGPQDPIPGDANLDDVVNDADASILAAHWQQTGMGWGDGDFNSDTVVNDADASILAAHWQESQEGTAPVPEPGTLVLLAGALLSLLVWRRR